jgi:3-oxoacyl-[acyl-carrier protein] reductase
MDLGLTGKVAFVSGGSRGIGRACARRLAEEGCKVMVVARGKPGVEAAVAELAEQGCSVAGHAADLTTAAGVAEAIAATENRFGMPDIVIANVHGGDPGDFLADGPEPFARAFDGLLLGVVHLARAALPAMQARRWGRVLVMGTAAAKEPAPGLMLTAANAARAASVNLVKSLADEFAGDGVTFNTVAVGWTETAHMREQVGEMAQARGLAADDLFKRLRKAVPVQRFAAPEEIAALAAFLCSAHAGYLTGCLLAADGGAHRSAW